MPITVKYNRVVSAYIIIRKKLIHTLINLLTIIAYKDC